MAGKVIDAKLRIAAEVQQAIAALKQLRKELVATGADAATAARGQAGPGGTDPAVRAVRERSAEERKAAAESRRLAKEKADADRAAAREAKRLGDEEAARRRRENADEKRRLRDIEDARKKADRGKSYQAAALAPQLNDIFVGLTTGQTPLQVALQQGPQITQIYGGVTNTFKALLAVLTPVRVALGGVALGFVATAAGIAAGYRESSQLRKELALTGNVAGTSLGQINALAEGISDSQQTAIGTVRDAAAAVLRLSGQTSVTIASTTRAATALAKLTGDSAEESVQAFKDQAAGITDWSVKANRAYSFLTAAQVDYIRSLERQGRVAEAIRFANEELAKTLEQRTVGAIGLLERSWNAAGRAVSFFWDQIKAIGRDDTTEAKLDRLTKKLGEVQARLAQRAAGGLATGRRASTDEAERSRLLQELDGLNRELVRRAEQTAAQREEQAKIKRESLEFRQLLANNSAAEAQQALAQREANLNAEAALVERAYAQQVESAFTRAQKLNSIEQRRAAAQRDAIARQVEIQRGLDTALKTPEEVQQQETRLRELDAQLIGSKARVAAAVAEGRRLIDEEARRLDDDIARRQAANAAASVAQVQDEPLERARQEALAQTSEARRELESLRRQQAAALAAGSNPELEARLREQVRAAQEALNEGTRRLTFDSLLQQANERLSALALVENELAQSAETGAIAVEEAERRKFEARAKALPQLRAIATQAAALAGTPLELNAVGNLDLTVQTLGDTRTELEKLARSEGVNAFTAVLNNFNTGALTLKESLLDAVGSFARAMLDVLNRRLATALVDQFIDAAGRLGGGGGGLGSIGTFIAGLFHTGGIVGTRGGMGRAISPLAFAGAQVLHSGGIAGLRPREVPAILEEGEEVLTEDDPRHRRNFSSNVGGVVFNSNISIAGARGGDERMANAGADLDRRMRQALQAWAADEMRPGGILAKR